jgi:hypothetical protein
MWNEILGNTKGKWKVEEQKQTNGDDYDVFKGMIIP